MAESASVGGGSVDPVSSAVQAAALVAQTVAGIVGENKQQGYMQAFQSLDQRDQVALARELQGATSNNQKLQILSNTFAQIEIQGQKSSVYLYAFAGVMAIGLLIAAIYISKK